MFCDPVELLGDLANTLQKPVAKLQPYWQPILATAQSWAYGWIVSQLSYKGYTSEQITGWDFGADWERSLALWSALVRGAALQAVDDKLLEMLDLRKDMETLQGLIIGGKFAYPEGDAGLPTTGDADTSTDIFVLPPSGGGDPWDDFPGRGRGEETRW